MKKIYFLEKNRLGVGSDLKYHHQLRLPLFMLPGIYETYNVPDDTHINALLFLYATSGRFKSNLVYTSCTVSHII